VCKVRQYLKLSHYAQLCSHLFGTTCTGTTCITLLNHLPQFLDLKILCIKTYVLSTYWLMIVLVSGYSCALCNVLYTEPSQIKTNQDGNRLMGSWWQKVRFLKTNETPCNAVGTVQLMSESWKVWTYSVTCSILQLVKFWVSRHG